MKRIMYLVCRLLGHRLTVRFDGARSGEPCHSDDEGECVYEILCMRCNDISEMLGGNEISALPDQRQYRRVKAEALTRFDC